MFGFANIKSHNLVVGSTLPVRLEVHEGTIIGKKAVICVPLGDDGDELMFECSVDWTVYSRDVDEHLAGCVAVRHLDGVFAAKGERISAKWRGDLSTHSSVTATPIDSSDLSLVASSAIRMSSH